MIWFICAIALLFLVMTAGLILKSVLVRSVNGNRVFNFKGLTASEIISKVLWAVTGTVLIIYCITLFVPLVWMLYNSVKDPLLWDMPGVSRFELPTLNNLHFEHYAEVLRNFSITQGDRTYGILDMFINSLYYAGVAPAVSVFWMTMMAYAMGRFKFFGNRFLYNLGLLIMMIPLTGGIASQMIIFQRWGLYDNMYVKVLLPPATAFSGLYFMIIYGAVKAIPKTYGEAAYIDGANEYKVMFRVILPMALPTIVTVYILSFIAAWNNYEMFLIWYPSTPNLSYGMYRMRTFLPQTGLSDVHVFAGFTIIIIPSMAIYLSGQKIMRSNLMVGGLKG